MGESEENLTLMIRNAAHGSDEAAERILEVLRRYAQSRLMRSGSNLSLQATLLADDAYMALVHQNPQAFPNRKVFFMTAAQVIRNLIIDHVRKKKAQKHGGAVIRINLDDVDVSAPQTSQSEADPEKISALIDKLESLNTRSAEVVKLRYFAGLSIEETANTLEISKRLVDQEWAFAKAWLHRELSA